MALANHRRLLLADESTSQLDNAAARGVVDDLRRLQTELSTTVIMGHPQPQVEGYVERVVLIRDGRTSTEMRYGGAPGEPPAEEPVIVDAGRLQLPAEYVEAVGLRGRARVRMEDGGWRCL